MQTYSTAEYAIYRVSSHVKPARLNSPGRVHVPSHCSIHLVKDEKSKLAIFRVKHSNAYIVLLHKRGDVLKNKQQENVQFAGNEKPVNWANEKYTERTRTRTHALLARG